MMDAAAPRSDNLLVILRRRLKLFLAIFAGVFALAVIAYVIIPTRYVATAAIIVAQQDLGLKPPRRSAPTRSVTRRIWRASFCSSARPASCG